MRHIVFTVLILWAIALFASACKTVEGQQIAIAACKSQCPIAQALAIDACDGDVDGVVTEKPGGLYLACVQEANLIADGCPVACDQIPLKESDPEPAE